MHTVLAVEGVCKRFGGLAALTEVSLQLQEEKIVGLIGPNGAGKTTLFNVIAGVYRPERGRILFRGRDITLLPSHERCRLGIARTFQIPKPFLRLSVLENATVGAFFGCEKRVTFRAAQERAAAAIEQVGLKGKEGVAAGQLTLVERKRLELARALATEPKVLLLDEVMAGLNPEELAQMVETIRRIRESGTTLLIIEHVMRAVMGICERVIVLNFGRIIAEGTPQEVSANEEVINAYLGTATDVLT